MRHDIPAALPLIAFTTGLATAGLLVNSFLCAIALVAVAFLWRKAAVALLFAALGLLLARNVTAQLDREARAFATLPSSQFAVIEAPLQRDWSPRGESHLLRASRFRANGIDFDAPLYLYVRFEPPPMQLEATVHAEGFLRRNERGQYSMAVKSPLLLSYRGELSRANPATWNRMLANRLRTRADAYPLEVALVEALILGRGERLTDEMRESFTRGGTYHLLVFSGMQIALAAGALALLLRWFHAPRASDWLLLSFAILAPLFIGPTASVARASGGIGLYALSRILKRPTSLENLWCVAALLRLMLEPRDLTDASFHLTYAGAGALLFLARERHWIARAIAAELAVTPLTLFHFHQFALGGSLVTLVMTPLILAMLSVSALVCATLATPLFELLGLLHRLCGWLNVIAWSGFFAAPPLLAMIAGFGLAVCALLLPPKRRAFAIATALLIPSLATIALHLARRDSPPRLTMLDIGQGDAILLREGRHTVLVDGGGRNDDARFGERTLLPMLLNRGVRRLDAVVVTHVHPDHCGGLPAVIRHLDARELWVNPRLFRGNCAQQLLALSHRTSIQLLRDGETRTIGALRFDVHLVPRTFRRSPENNASVVLKVTHAMCKILLTGDIERDGESWLSDRDLRADILKVPHHGSRTSTTPPLLDAVRPRIALLSCGRNNLFGHPHPTVVEALANRGIRTHRTDLGGTIDVELGGKARLVHWQIDTPRSAAYP